MRGTILAGASALACTGLCFAETSAQVQELEAKVASLQSQLSELKGDSWLTEQRSDEIRSIVQDVLADADTRASLLQSGMTAGYDDGFMIASPDGNFELKINGQMQVRYVYNQQDDGPEDDNRGGFENTRTKLFFTGHVGNPDWIYRIEGDFSRDGGAFSLEDAYIGYVMGDNWEGFTLLVGQMKVPVLREYLVHSMDQLLVERSLTAYQSPAASRTQGIALDYRNDMFHGVVAFTDGGGGGNDPAGQANSPWNNEDTEYAFSARAEVLLSGEWDQFNDFTSPQGSPQGLMIGGGIHYQDAEYGTAPADELSVLVATADVSFEFEAANIFAAFYYNSFDDDALNDRDEYGFVVQGGYYFTDTIEAFARYEWYDFDTEGAEDLSIITVGLNSHYGDNLKASADFGWAMDPLELSSPITGYRVDTADSDGQWVIRTQLQLLF
jgi:hypothetical protein